MLMFLLFRTSLFPTRMTSIMVSRRMLIRYVFFPMSVFAHLTDFGRWRDCHVKFFTMAHQHAGAEVRVSSFLPILQPGSLFRHAFRHAADKTMDRFFIVGWNTCDLKKMNPSIAQNSIGAASSFDVRQFGQFMRLVVYCLCYRLMSMPEV